jgi:pimeloyl-ACP methyl ester carboxylesterase
VSDDRSRTNESPPPHFVVIVPGYMGSLLRDKTNGEIVWVDFTSIPKNPLKWQGWIDSLFERMAYPNENLEPAGIVEDVIFAPPWIKQEQYSRLAKALEKMGYRGDPSLPEEERNLYTFSYDWRQDNRISARELGEAVERWSQLHNGAEAWLIGHSNGGIISRWYIEKEGGKDCVGRLFLMGSPWDGAPKSMKILHSGLDTLFRRGFNLFNIPQRTRDVLRTFPSSYQLIPVQNPFLRDLDNEIVDVFSGEGWLDDPLQRQYLEDGRKFNQDLGTEASVETLCFFGRKLPTLTNGAVSFEAAGGWRAVQWSNMASGDGTVPERSAVHPNAHVKLPFVAGHGDIYINEAVLEILEWEMVGKYRGQARAAIFTDRVQVVFEPQKDDYSPQEQIKMWAQISEADSLTPITDADVKARLIFREALPGAEDDSQRPPAQSQVGPEVRLGHQSGSPGRYEGVLEAPPNEGYYDIEASVKVLNERTLRLREMIEVETIPDGVIV